MGVMQGERESDDPHYLLAVFERLFFCYSGEIAFFIHNLDTRNRATTAGAGGMAISASRDVKGLGKVRPGVFLKQTIV